MSKLEGNIFGKDIITYSSRQNKRYSPDDIGQYLSSFKLRDALILIGKVSYKISWHKKILVTQDTPISNGILAYLSMRLIESANDYGSENMTLGDLRVAIDMFLGLLEPMEKDSYSNPQGCLIRYGSSQFDYERENHHLLARTLIIYRDLWDNSQVDINSAIQNFSGLTLQNILVLSQFFTGSSVKGYFYLNESLGKHPDILKGYLDFNKQKAFVNWIACRYSEFRNQLKEDLLPPDLEYDEYEKFRFNPLYSKPVIIPDYNIRYGSPQVYITPIPILIYEQVTRGLYFSLSDYFRSDKGNPFRGAFGSVFQEYIGLLLKKTFGNDNVKCEWRYGSKKQAKDTPDWFVIQNGVAVLIEVKQSGLYLDAKKWGELEKIQNDLKKTIGAGVNQMWEFEHDIASGLCSVPDWFDNIKITERLVITYDRPYFLNSILRDEVRLLYPSISEIYHWHTIAVEELEYFLGIVGLKLIEALTEKRLDDKADRMDFRDFYSRKYPKDSCKNSYLDSVQDKFVSDYFPSLVKEQRKKGFRKYLS
jgi:hypothetical protein